jgi:hypothetical protein
MKEESVSRLTLDLPADLHRRLKVLAAERGVSMRSLLLTLVERVVCEACKEAQPGT